MTAAPASDEVHALTLFRELIAGEIAPCRLEVAVDGPQGVARLCIIETLLRDMWPSTGSRELLWLSRAPAGAQACVQLRAYAPTGRLLGQASYRLPVRHDG